MSSKTYYTNSEAARLFAVSNATIAKYIDKAKQKKNNLKLIEVKNKFYISRIPQNLDILESLAQNGKKFKSLSSKVNIKAKPEFLSLFEPEQLIEFISDLQRFEINEKFSYLAKKGAENWDLIYQSEASKLQSNSNWMLDNLYSWVSPYMLPNLCYNIFDVGPGNGLPIINFLGKLKADKKLQNYFCIDISKEINQQAKENVTQFLPDIFGGSLIADIENSKFGTYFYENTASNSANLIFFIGGTISNVPDRIRVFKNIQSGMTKNDFFVFTFSLDTPQNRKAVEYVLNEQSDKHQNWLPEFLGIQIDPSKNRADYNPEGNYKFKTFKVEKDYTIDFPVFNQTKTVYLPQGSEITTWRHYLISLPVVENELNIAGLDLLCLHKDRAGQTGLIIAKVKS